MVTIVAETHSKAIHMLCGGVLFVVLFSPAFPASGVHRDSLEGSSHPTYAPTSSYF